LDDDHLYIKINHATLTGLVLKFQMQWKCNKATAMGYHYKYFISSSHKINIKVVIV